ncbi:hypothetical protein HHK36_029550 [Tetracentron sinense]|uniref:Uncharacterized protein n=1 Tax=Tetracentron sinense TaxID=13715 RepID=A0A834YDV9_TETSI|nr:hypothetical protein HHK36_029550 [Tetracentron sinense]
MSKPWGGIGAWAADSEKAEEEERERAASGAGAGAGESQNFPSLREAATSKPKKKKMMTLSEFTSGTYVGPGGARRSSSTESKGLTTDEMLRLPTGPKERSADEMESGRLGGGFSSYGRTGPPSGRMRENVNEGSWGGGRKSYGDFDDERRGSSSRASDFDQPSRADEVENWATTKKPPPLTSTDSGRNDRYSPLGSGSGSGSGSRSEEVDNWGIGKRSVPGRSTSFGSGFRDSAPDSDRRSWGGPGGGGGGGGERQRLILDPPRGEVALNEPVKSSKPSPFGAARPREEVLAEKGLDWKKVDSEIEIRKTSRPTSSHSSRPSSSQSSRPESPAPQVLEGASKARPKVNPFGDAKPREVLLQEQGKDWRKIDLELEHRRVERHEQTVEIEQNGSMVNLRPIHEQSVEIEQNGFVANLCLGHEQTVEIEQNGSIASPRQGQSAEIEQNGSLANLRLGHKQIVEIEQNVSLANLRSGQKQSADIVQNGSLVNLCPGQGMALDYADDAFMEVMGVFLDLKKCCRRETEEEKILKEEIDRLKTELEKQSTVNANGESLQRSGGEQASLHEQLRCKEEDLELLIRELNDKVRFGQKAIERPGSGAGRIAGFPERPPSQSGVSEESRSMEFLDRPRSRGTGGGWSRPGDDRRAFPDSRERGFLNRDMDRPKSRERW